MNKNEPYNPGFKHLACTSNCDQLELCKEKYNAELGDVCHILIDDDPRYDQAREDLIDEVQCHRYNVAIITGALNKVTIKKPL
ncbi:MAG: hypothetical protein GY861_01250 [bacterium]|nr:hypothetical protein [bacterium]